MYSIKKKRVIKKKWKFRDFSELENLNGFLLPSRNNTFNVCDVVIKNIKVVNTELGRPVVSEYVGKKYRRLLKILTELLISDDDSGDSFRLALDRIEKFRLEIKIKYRRFLEKKELEVMAKQLRALQRQAKLEFAELQNSLMNVNEVGKSK